MSLREYRRKRDFRKTSEPSGKRRSDREGSRFVVQKHAARRLHYDLRLELDGTLKSWAVTRGPSLVPGDKRLAVHTEDHPLEYLDFEGLIPEGEYGAGRMIVWDTGTWTTDHDPNEQLTKGHLSFQLAGEKLNGRWHLVRLRRDRERRASKTAKENWLLIKSDDDAASEMAGRDLLAEAPRSVKSGRTIEEVGTAASPEPRERSKTPRGASSRTRAAKPPLPGDARAAPLPGFVAPCLATLCEKPPVGPRWRHEIKFDGYRLIARIERGRVILKTRNGLDWTHKFQSLVPDLAALPLTTAMLDGEVVVETTDGVSSFADLQADLSAGETGRFLYYAFDILHLDGRDVSAAPLDDRRSLLRKLVPAAGGRVRYSEDFDEDGSVVLKHACRLGLEGIVSKRRDAPYRSGRSKVWYKSKCVTDDEFVVVGFTPSTVQRRAIGALLLARPDEAGGLSYAGRVGTGFSTALAGELWERLDLLKTSEPGWAAELPTAARRGVHWVTPNLVAGVEYRTLTADGLLRHASFKGLRDDKSPGELVPGVAPRPSRTGAPSPDLPLTHADRPLWPADGVTKEGLAAYLTDVWPRMAAFVADRPLALVRCPNGIADTCFFQKHRFAGMNPSITVTTDPEDGKDILSVNSADGLVALAQASVCEIHTWGAPLADIEKPDMVVFDLDPAEDTPWSRVVDAAGEVRERLAASKYECFLKTSGGKGLHVVVPLVPDAGWPSVKAFAEGIARQMSADSPARYTAVLSKKARKGRIFVDYLRNGRGATTVAAYSPRARPGAPVSMPLAWQELSAAIRPDRFTIANALNRLARLGPDPWADFWSAGRKLDAD